MASIRAPGAGSLKNMLMAATPAQPLRPSSGSLSRVTPPRANTGREVSRQTAFNESIPWGGPVMGLLMVS
jgi:hypothetical protein